MRQLAVVLAVGMLAPAGSAPAQERLQTRMNATTYASVKAIIDSAKRAGLPARPIEDKALEGVSAGAVDSTIIRAIRTFTTQLGEASKALGKKATADELRAAVGAIDAGVPPRDLGRIRASADERSIATALTVINDIVVRGVPVGTSTNLVVSLLRAKVRDAELLDFVRLVRVDIAHGADPTTAASARARGMILTFGISKPAN